MILNFILIVAIILPLVFLARAMYDSVVDKRATGRLFDMMFPKGEAQCKEVVDNICKITKNRFSQEEIIDYYLKIKGLQMIDLHTNGDRFVRSYLMKPTKIRLNYFEQVKFYEAYLNYPQAVGQNAVTEEI